MAREFDANWQEVVRPGEVAPVAVVDRADFGLECPVCGCRHFETRETTPRPGMILRRKACRHCGHRVTTRERVVGGGEKKSRQPLDKPDSHAIIQIGRGIA